MTVTAKCLLESTQLAASQTTLYTANGLRAILDKVSATNVSGSAGESYGFPELVGHVLNQGGFISVIAGTAAAINLRISGREVTQ